MQSAKPGGETSLGIMIIDMEELDVSGASKTSKPPLRQASMHPPARAHVVAFTAPSQRKADLTGMSNVSWMAIGSGVVIGEGAGVAFMAAVLGDGAYCGTSGDEGAATGAYCGTSGEGGGY